MGWISALSGRINIHDHCGLMWLDYYPFFVCPFPLDCWTQTRSTVWEKTHFRTCRISRCCLYMTTKSKLWPRALSPHCVQFRLCEYKNITIIRINIHYMNTLTGHSHPLSSIICVHEVFWAFSSKFSSSSSRTFTINCSQYYSLTNYKYLRDVQSRFD